MPHCVIDYLVGEIFEFEFIYRYNSATKLHDVALLQMAEPIKPDDLITNVPVSCILYDEISNKVVNKLQ